MQFAKVMGTIVASQKDEKLEGLRFQLLEVLSADGKLKGEQVVAVDSVGAGNGEIVLFATGSSARQTTGTENRPVDAVIMAIVDNWEMDGKVIFDKYQTDTASV